MIPLYLSIEGMYSYQEKQEIYFDRLTTAGLFGIFGKVGSGKSTILEAMMFSLYGKIDRLNSSGDNLKYNIMNLKCDQMVLEFRFLAQDKQEYCFISKLKRNGKNFNQVNPPERKAYRIENNDLIPLESNDATHILGVTYENFKRTVIIPQGKFKEFLELGGKDRTEMMNELFQLDAYDLGETTNLLGKEAKQWNDQLDGNLVPYTGFNEEGLKALQNQLIDFEKEWAAKKDLFSQAEQKYEQVKRWSQLRENYLKTETDLMLLKTREAEIETLKHQLSQYRRLKKVFGWLIEQEKLAKQKLSLHQNQESQTLIQIQHLQRLIEKNVQDFSQIQSVWEDIENEKIRIDEYRKIKEINQKSIELSQLQFRLDKAQVVIADTQNNILNAKSRQEQLQNQLVQLKSQKMDVQLINDLTLWYEHQRQLQLKWKDISDEVLQLEEKKAEWKLFLSNHQLETNSWEKQLSDREQQLMVQTEALTRKENQYQVQRELQVFSHQLESGKPCPLCGALEHPQVMKNEDLVLVFQEVELEKNALKNAVLELLQVKERVQKKSIEFEQHQIQQKHRQEQAVLLEKEIIQRENEFAWHGFEPRNSEFFEKLKKKSFELEAEIGKIELILQKVLSECETERQNLERYEKGNQNLIYKSAELKSEKKMLENQIQLLLMADYNDWSDERLNTLILEKEQQLSRVQNQIKSIEEEKNSLHLSLNTAQTTLSFEQKNIEECKQQLLDFEKQWQQKLTDLSLTSAGEVHVVLNQLVNEEQLDSDIQLFEKSFHLYQENLKSYQKELQSFTFDENEAENILKNYQVLKIELEQTLIATEALKGQLRDYSQKCEEKKKLEVQKEKADVRNKNLQMLAQMFKAKGFVNFVSTQYLFDLCEMANQRFERLTRNSLSLKINENNDFMVVDHLNEDKERSVKTLSGGQFFQASLSLALALAESTRSLNQNERNFFFIDEGFGTQDAESVELIFETLNDLQHENRIVGIISHVEDLKERIPASISITRNELFGSKVLIA